jgi:hypothetical protein
VTRVDFTLNGVRHSLDAASVRTALRGGAPDDVREHWVEVDGVRWPPKQALARATSLGRAEFTSHMALRQLQRLGFATSAWGSARQTASAARTETRSAAPPSTAAQTPAPGTADIVLVGCSNSKAPTARPASELFTGAAFAKARDHAFLAGVPWYVLSAKFGLLAPDEVVAPYDVYLGAQSSRYREDWGSWVVTQLGEWHELSGRVVEVHAGRVYCDPLSGPLAAAGATLYQPLAGLRQGQRLAWYGRGQTAPEARPSEHQPTQSPVPDVGVLLDQRNAVAPATFLASGRAAADAPGLYSWWVDVPGAHALSAGLGHRIAPGLVYAGRAGGARPNRATSTNTLWGRVGGMHLGGNRNFSTFRLTLTACLSPPDGPVLDEGVLSEWMQRHLRVAVLPLPPELVTAGEARLLALTDPPLNLRDVPPTPLRRSLSRQRSAVSARG